MPRLSPSTPTLGWHPTDFALGVPMGANIALPTCAERRALS
jgi:hypothetical protein